MKNKITGWLIDLKNGKSGTVEFEDSLENLYQLCNCETIDITVRKPWQRRETGKEIKEYGFGIFKLMQNDGKIFTTCEEKKEA